MRQGRAIHNLECGDGLRAIQGMIFEIKSSESVPSKWHESEESYILEIASPFCYLLC